MPGGGVGVAVGRASATAASTLACMSGVGSGAGDVHAATTAARMADSASPMMMFRTTLRIAGFYRANGHVFALSLQEAGSLRGVESENLFHKLETCGNPRLQISRFHGNDGFGALLRVDGRVEVVNRRAMYIATPERRLLRLARDDGTRDRPPTTLHAIHSEPGAE